MSRRRSFRGRARYKFDTNLTHTHGTNAVIPWLGVIIGAVVLATGSRLSLPDIVVSAKGPRHDGR